MPLALLALVVAVFADVLLVPGGRVLSSLGEDGSTYFVYARQFAFNQLSAGHFPLWNPHAYSGTPFFGSFQSSMLYLPNWILYPILPFAKAMDWEYASAVFLTGFFVALWAMHYDLHPLAAVLAGCLAMFSRAFYGGIVAGHLAPMDAMAWTPLVLLSVDASLDKPGLKWVLIGIFALSMLILGGYPPILFTTTITCAIYGALRLIKAPRPGRTLLAVSIIGAGAVLICAAQLWVGIQASSEGVRQGGLPLNIASSFSLSFDNLLTVLVPDFFVGSLGLIWGGLGGTLFFGLVGFLIALFGLSKRFPHRGVFVATALALLLIALGKNTPLFALLYKFVPIFRFFRRPAEYTYEFVLFMAMLSAFGMDAFIRSKAGARTASLLVLILGLVLGVLGALARAGAGGIFGTMWRRLFLAVVSSGEHFVPDSAVANAYFMESAKRLAGTQCLIAAALCLAVAALFWLRTRRRQAAYVLAVLAIGEAFIYAHAWVEYFDLAVTVPVATQRLIAAQPGDYRILNPAVSGVFALSVADSAMVAGAHDIWGYDPVVSKRYAEFMDFSQGGNAGFASDALFFPKVGQPVRDPALPQKSEPGAVLGTIKASPMLRLLRLRYVYWGIDNGFYRSAGDLPHVLLVDQWRRLERRPAILIWLSLPTFDGSKTVILENNPVPQPVPGSDPGTARIVDQGTDWLNIEADAPRPMLLLITDSYSKYWRATALPGSSQSQYQVMPADYTLMAIPLTAGHHLIRMGYAPSGWVIGRWISLLASLIYLAIVIRFASRSRSRPDRASA